MEVGDLEMDLFNHLLGLCTLGKVVMFPSGLGLGVKIATLDDPQGDLLIL